MTTTFQFGLILNALFFLFYGFQSLNSQLMIDEFKRFGMTDSQRKFTGILQIAGSAGVLAGLIIPVIGLLAAAGFTAMMLVAFLVRIKIKDSILQAMPSIIFILINGWLTVGFFKLW
ncbi:DoxX family protein [Rhodohalobacter barkolensis]|uniref:DoxX family protein n=1 Tax=Rhodohalobacter barkolensis TaxID=2053187 RepID=UPI0013FD3024|nr:DoxX family protein [Rhodohalobacter barkolensis]